MTWQRVLTALVLIPVVVAIVLFTPTWAVALATAVITVLALWEYFALGDAIGHRAYRLWAIVSAIGIIALQWLTTVREVRLFGVYRSDSIDWRGYALLSRVSPYSIFFAFILGVAALTLWTRRPLVEALPAAGISASSLMLVAFPLSFAVRLDAIPISGPIWLLFALAIIWASDTVAYFAGRAIGKHPLAPHISPKKTWEGSIAGMLGSLLVAYAFHYWLTIPLPHLFAMAALGNIAGQMGDLLESACKRSAGVKDSGGLLPGHGGILDRIDALILAIPVIWYYLVLVNPHL
jgi:phosphatidate cytidylyltransferase